MSAFKDFVKKFVNISFDPGVKLFFHWTNKICLGAAPVASLPSGLAQLGLELWCGFIYIFKNKQWLLLSGYRQMQN